MELPFEVGLVKDTVERPWRQVIAWLARHSDSARLGWMLVLAVAAARCHKSPAIILQQSKYIPDFHMQSLS